VTDVTFYYGLKI